MKTWVNTISHEHVLRGVAGGFTQAGHGKVAPLRKLRRDDRIVFYSPRTALESGQPLQRFTAIGRIADDEPYQVEVTPDFHPWRRKVAFIRSDETAIHPLLERLGFIQNKANWGFYFRRGLFEIAETDMAIIASAMNARID